MGLFLERFWKHFSSNGDMMCLHKACHLFNFQQALLARQEVQRNPATYDPLTGLWLGPAVMNILESKLDRATREKSSFSLIMAGLDHFKQINDKYDRITGATVLRETARRISRCLQINDIVGRYGDDEFICVLPGCGKNNALKLAQSIRAMIGDTPIKTAKDMVCVTITLGVAAYDKVKEASGEALIRMAETALCLAKNNGCNRVALISKEELAG